MTKYLFSANTVKSVTCVILILCGFSVVSAQSSLTTALQQNVNPEAASVYRSTAVVDSLAVEEKIHEGREGLKIMFPVGGQSLDVEIADNRRQVENLDRIFRDTTAFLALDSLEIVSAASIDGSFAGNERLSRNRAASVRDMLINRYPRVDANLFRIRAKGEDWEGFRETIVEDSQIPRKSEILAVIDDSNLSPDAKEAALRYMDGGKPWSYMRQHILPKQRYGASVVLYYNVEKVERLIRLQRDTIINTVVKRDTVVQVNTVRDTVINTVIQRDTIIIRDTIRRECKPMRFALKTNLLYAGLTYTPNLAFEVALSEGWSLDFGAGYNPWNRNGEPGNNKKKVHWMAQLEGRYHLDRVFNGHFFGVHLLGTKYNIANHELPWLFGEGSEAYRYCGWAAGAGISYGYQWCLSDHWGLEATLGAGYMYMNYDKYTEPRCGYLVESDVVDNYWGITRAGISLMYKFGERETKSNATPTEY